jgi:tetratricopeptide (TPR) repeat protein
MPSKKQRNNPKKQSINSVPQEEDTQVQQQLTNYRQTAAALYSSNTTNQAEAALAPVTSLSESAQIVLLQALSREKKTEAADILLAVNTFAPLKEVRKEARRSLIRLESSKTYPQWTPPSPPLPVVEEPVSTTPPRFWKGQFTDTRAVGEMQLLLFWEHGDNYKEVRTIGFLLDFSHQGVKDFFTELSNKRQVENRMERMREQFNNIALVDCSLSDGKRLVEEALEVNQQYGTKPHPDYTRNLSLVRHLLLDAPEDAPQQNKADQPQELRLDEARNLLDQLLELGLDPEETVAGFLDTWLRGDYEAAYTVLAKDSPLREGLTSEEWVARRLSWAEQAHPTQGKSEIAYRHEDVDDDDADLAEDVDDDEEETAEPSVLETEVMDTTPEVEAFWSLVLTDTEVGSGLKELPHATAVYAATGRHWFWTKYTLTREGNEWRILTMIDASAEALALPMEELQQQLAEIVEFAAEQLDLVEAMADEEDAEDVEDVDVDDEEDVEDADDDDEEELEFEELAEHFEEMMWVTTRAMHYTDALIRQTPDDSSLYDMGYDQATAIQENERAAAYIEMQAERFPDIRGEALRKLAMAQLNIAKTYEENSDLEQSYHFIEEAEKTLRTSIAIDSAPMGNILLAETLIAQKKQLDEAEKMLQQVLTQPDIDPKESTLAEAGLGHIAQEQEHYEQALQHYQRAIEISPDLSGLWFNIGLMQHQLGQLEEAEESHLRSIDENPTETGAYIDLAGIYTDASDLDAAEGVLQEGIELNPDAAELLAALALVYINKGDLRHAKEYLDEAEDIDENLDIVQAVHTYYNEARQAQQRPQKQKGKSRKFKKR